MIPDGTLDCDRCGRPVVRCERCFGEKLRAGRVAVEYGQRSLPDEDRCRMAVADVPCDDCRYVTISEECCRCWEQAENCLRCHHRTVELHPYPVCFFCRRRHLRRLEQTDWSRVRYIASVDYQRWWTSDVCPEFPGRRLPDVALALKDAGEIAFPIDEYLPEIFPETSETWVACTPRFFLLNAEEIIEAELLSHWSDAHEHVARPEGLQKLLDAWVLENAAGCFTLQPYPSQSKEPWIVVIEEQIAFAITYAMWKLFGGNPPTLECHCHMEAGDSPCPMHGDGE